MSLVQGVYIDKYYLFSRFGNLTRPEFETIRDQMLTKIFKPDLLPLTYRYPAYVVMSLSMNTRVIEEDDLLTWIHIIKENYVWATPVDFRRREIGVTLYAIQSRQIKRYVFPLILKVLQAN